ncbi:hypothetical protein BC941DRAFT_409377 [Chlamydoabsidia padenii]|nr:hypothetical protein BC941DRAFT_409377 [Chlamydoabsidia padenii]
MDSLPLEILQSIFTHLSQHQLAICGLVCHSWSLAVREQLYHSIQLYTSDQIQRLIMHPCEEKQRIRQLTFHCHIQDTDTWRTLQQICPRVIKVDILPDQNPGLYGVCCHRRRYPLAEGWSELKHLPVWHKDPTSIWAPRLAPHLHTLTMDLYFYNSILDLPSHLPFLRSLELYASRGFFHLDERSFDTIHAACPQLQSLSLTSFHLCLTQTPTLLQPGLTTLTLDHVSLIDASGYTFLGHAYPELQTLRLKDVRVTNDPHATLIHLITQQCLKLTELDIVWNDTEDPIDHVKMVTLWAGLNTWLSGFKNNPALDRFHWTCCLPNDDGGKKTRLPSVPTLPSFVFLTSLAITIDTCQPLLGSRAIMLPRLKSLALTFSNPDRQIIPLARLSSICPNLTRLDVSGGVLSTNDGGELAKIRELMLSETKVCFDSDVVALCRVCPRLQHLTLRHLRCQLLNDEDYVPAKEAGGRFMLGVNLGTIRLAMLDVANLWYESMMMADPRYTKRVAVQQIHVHQLIVPRSKAYCHSDDDDPWMNKVQVHITCHSVDRIRIQQSKYC